MRSFGSLRVSGDKVAAALLGGVVVALLLSLLCVLFAYVVIPQNIDSDQAKMNEIWKSLDAALQVNADEKIRDNFGIAFEANEKGEVKPVYKPESQVSANIDKALAAYNAYQDDEGELTRADFDNQMNEGLVEIIQDSRTYGDVADSEFASTIEFVRWSLRSADVVPVELLTSEVLPSKRDLNINGAVSNYAFAAHRDNYPNWEFRPQERALS